MRLTAGGPTKMRPIKIGLLSCAVMVVVNANPVSDPVVVLGGAGPAPYFEKALDGIADALTASGVKSKVLPGDAHTRTELLDETKQRGYSNLLYVTLESPRDGRSDPSRGNLVASCFVEGKKAWEEESKGPLVLPRGVDQELDSMLNGLVKKITKRAGGPCLPK